MDRLEQTNLTCYTEVMLDEAESTLYLSGYGVFPIRQCDTLCISTAVTDERQFTAERFNVTHSHHGSSDRNKLAV